MNKLSNPLQIWYRDGGQTTTTTTTTTTTYHLLPITTTTTTTTTTTITITTVLRRTFKDRWCEILTHCHPTNSVKCTEEKHQLTA